MSGIKELKPYLRDHFTPVLRRLGFKGSGMHFRKVTANNYIYTVWVQADKWGEGCAVELGTALDFLPNTIGEVVVPNKVAVIDCEFRKWLTPPTDRQYWLYGKDGSFQEIAEDMARNFEVEGMQYFGQFGPFPEPLASLTVEDLDADNPASPLAKLCPPTMVRLALILTRLHLSLNNGKQASTFAEWGLRNIRDGSGSGSALIPIFQDLWSKAQL